ncbi:dihydrolipoamide acetyltransferase family protein [Rudanella lutea]|uniref:dihydrolipoamide acetyltransferase family protein n=1 Tax=Rudanella lutea TaxID=451374 RepID=UPI00039E36B9|nr:dihydrolipoamide acetyltransferase family protein [Rudanella lutea]
MALVDMVMPKMGESIMECTVIHWLKQPGERIEADDSILEVATDKVDTEVPATHAGILKECLVQEGDVVPVGAPIARIETEASVSAEPATPVAAAPVETSSTPVAQETPEETEPEVLQVAQGLESSIASMRTRPDLADGPSFAGRFYSPLVLSIAKEEGIGREELDRIPGTGAENRLTKKDILGYLENRSAEVAPVAPIPAPAPKAAPASTAPATAAKAPASVSLNGQTDIIQMDRMRKMIAQRMVESKQISPHVSSFVEVDMTPVVQWRARMKDEFKRKTGENLTFTPILIEALVKAIKDFPMINVSVDGDTIIVKKAINIGMAVALPSGNLIVPVIHDADSYNLVGLTKKVNDLSKRARENKLTADDLANGTYTMSNIGTFGNIMGTPIILQPQVAIMAFGAIVKKPAVIETPQGDLIGIRQLMFLSHSYDHRVVDGSLGGQFVKRVADYLEGFDTDQKI